jgi:hypothetical protein
MLHLQFSSTTILFIRFRLDPPLPEGHDWLFGALHAFLRIDWPVAEIAGLQEAL